MDDVQLLKYAKLVTKTGVNLQKDQTLVISSPIECASFVRVLAEVAYQAGARDVVISWNDELFNKIRYLQAPDCVFTEFPQWQLEFYNHYVRKGAAFVSIAASEPELLQDVKPERLAVAQKTRSTALMEYRTKLMANENSWCVVSLPTVAWAQKVFPLAQDKEEAMAKLWAAIAATVRLDAPDPVAAWEEHKNNLQMQTDYLNSCHFKSLHYQNSLGTDLTVELPEGHLWLAGAEHTPAGVEFVSNMPTEEVFTLPAKNGVQGRVVSSKPLHYNGNLIENFSLTFAAGQVVDFSAEKGYEVLKGLLETDEGARQLGEAALVPVDSPLAKLDILFYNTLFDENASCHFALGKAYPVCLSGGERLSQDELATAGVNDSLLHVDFMIGTDDLSITGLQADGTKIPVFRDGNFILRKSCQPIA